MVAADAVALMSDFEGMPNVVLESMLCGTPVVATAVDGTTEAVVDGVTGLLIPRGDVRGMSEALQRIKEDSQLRDRLGAAARRRALDEFTADVNVERFLRVYERVLGEAKREPA
jgi:glycosyltransferase involved in cell wall biosynthesis